MRWRAWLGRGEPAESGARESIARRESAPDEEGPLGFWFAGGAYAGSVDLTPGAVQREQGTPVPGHRGLHASASVLDALAHAPGGRLCRVRLGGTVVIAGAQLAATERTILASTDATATVRALSAAWIERALASAMEETELSSAAAHRALAQAARERAIAAGERLRDAAWVLEEGAGRVEGPARARAMGAQEGARRALREARTAACAHEAAAHFVEAPDLRAAARAIELVIEALVELEPSTAEAAHAAVRARLDRELERALRAELDAGAPEPSRDPYEAVDPSPAPHRGEALMDALERTLAAHGVRSVHPLVLSEPGVQVLLRCASKDAAQRAIDAIDASAELGALGVHAIGVWGASDRSVSSRALRERGELDPVRWQASVDEALERPALGRDRDALLRAWLALEPSVVSAAWIEGEVLALALDGSASAHELLARLAAHHPRCCAISGPGRPALATCAAVERLPRSGLDALDGGALVYTRSDGLADPSRPVVRAPAGRPREREPFVPRATSWVDAIRELSAGYPTADLRIPSPGRALARRLRQAGVCPVAVVVSDPRALIRRADASPDLERLGIGVAAIIRSPLTPPTADEWAFDRRLQRALDASKRSALLDRILDAPLQPFPTSGLTVREMELRRHLAAFDEIECAGWLWSREGVLAVRVSRSSHGLIRVEAALAQAFPSLKLVLACSSWASPSADEIEIARASPGACGDAADEDLPHALAEVFAGPDVYQRDSMLAAPRQPAPERRKTPEPASALPTVLHPSARCPRCEVEYALPSDTPLNETRCGLCGNACLIPVRGPRPPNLARRASEPAHECPSCARPLALIEPVLHARCPHCKTAVVPILAER